MRLPRRRTRSGITTHMQWMLVHGVSRPLVSDLLAAGSLPNFVGYLRGYS